MNIDHKSTVMHVRGVGNGLVSSCEMRGDMRAKARGYSMIRSQRRLHDSPLYQKYWPRFNFVIFVRPRLA